MSKTFPKSDRLCGQMTIQCLYKDGHRFTVWPLRVTYLPAEQTQVLIWAPKSLFKHAVDRNHMRRLMREAWRRNREKLISPQPYQVAINYIDREQQPYHRIEKAMNSVFHKLNQIADDR